MPLGVCILSGGSASIREGLPLDGGSAPRGGSAYQRGGLRCLTTLWGEQNDWNTPLTIHDAKFNCVVNTVGNWCRFLSNTVFSWLATGLFIVIITGKNAPTIKQSGWYHKNSSTIAVAVFSGFMSYRQFTSWLIEQFCVFNILFRFQAIFFVQKIIK